MTDMPSTEQYHGPLSKLLEMDDLPKQLSVIQDAWRKLFCMNTAQPFVTATSGNFNWEPCSDPSSENFKWEPGTDTSVGWDDYDDIKIRIENFATFWYNRILSGPKTFTKGYFGIDIGIKYPSFKNSDVNYFINTFLSFCEKQI